MVFDLMEEGGASTRSRPLIERRSRVEALLGGVPDLIRFSRSFDGEDGVRLFNQV